MQTKDLVVGTDYAYDRDYRSRHYRSNAERVTVVEVSGSRTTETWNGRKVTETGVVVTYATGDRKGEEFVVKPATLTRTWSEEHGERVQRGKYEAERKRREEAERTQRAEQAFALHEALVAAGAKVGLSYTYNDAHYDALVAAGFSPATEVDFYGRSSHLHSAVNDLSDLMERGKVDLAQVAVLLGLGEPPAPADSLDNYDLDEVDA